jgi:uncharacterized membrane protein
MKKLIWILSVLTLVVTCIVLQFMPQTVPIHFTATGEIDGWGSKYTCLLMPGIMLVNALFFRIVTGQHEKKAENAALERDRAAARSNAKVLKIAGAATTVMFTAIQGLLLYLAFRGDERNAANSPLGVTRITCILLGALYIVLANFMPKTRMNSNVGVRVKWSMYNDVTWMKTNRFGAGALTVAGLLTAVTAIFADEKMCLVMMFVYLTAAVAAVLIYARRVYKEETAKDGKNTE